MRASAVQRASEPRQSAARLLAQLAQRLGPRGAGFTDMDSDSDEGGALDWGLAVTRQADREDVSRRRAIAQVNAARQILGLKIKRSKAGPGDKRKIRGAAISKLMKRGMTLPEASKHLKAHPELL